MIWLKSLLLFYKTLISSRQSDSPKPRAHVNYKRKKKKKKKEMQMKTKDGDRRWTDKRIKRWSTVKEKKDKKTK